MAGRRFAQDNNFINRAILLGLPSDRNNNYEIFF